MARFEDTFHGIAKSLRKRPELKPDYDFIADAIKSKGVGNAATKSEQAVSKWEHPEVQTLIEHSRGLARKVTRAENRLKGNPLNDQLHKNLAEAKFNLEHESKFYVNRGEARVIGTVRKHDKDVVRPVTGVTVGYSKWNPKLKGLPKPTDLTNAVLG